MNEQIIQIIGEILAAVAVYFFGYISKRVVPKVIEWIEAKVGVENTEKLLTIIDSFVRSAQIQFKEEDPDGTIRKQYVVSQLEKLGYLINEEINAYIESRVLNLNLEEKAVQPYVEE